MNLIEQLGLRALHRIDPERAHALSLRALGMGIVSLPGVVTSPRLVTHFAGLTMPNPIGLAAGYDKNACAIGPLSRAGFGFIEVGAATPHAQGGNAKPRLFRLTADRAAINRFGFNNDGAEAICARLAARKICSVPVGLNLGANKDSLDRAADFVAVLARCGPYADFATVNVSSPNTERLRDLQGRAALMALLAGVMDVCAGLARPIPVFLKISPDLTDDELAEIAGVAMAQNLDGIIATNTTITRTGLKSESKHETGGLSGAPLFEKSTRVIAVLSKITEGRLPIIGVGGISTSEQAYAKIRAGAGAVQLYTAMVYEGLSLIPRIARGLDALLQRDGFASVSDAVGTDRDVWL